MKTHAHRFSALVALVVVVVHLLSGCAPDRAPASGATRIVVSIPPLAWLVRTLAPDADVTVLIPQGASPHGYELTPAQASALREADVVLLVGLSLEPAGVEQSLSRVAGEQLVIRLEDALGPVELDDHDHADDEHDHSHAIDPHLWLDPSFMRFGAAQLASALGVEAAPALNEISAIELAYTESLAPYRGARIVGIHDAWGRVAERFGLEAPASIMARFELEATPGAMEEAAKAIRDGSLAVIVAEPQMDPMLAQRLAELTGAPVVTLDPIGGQDWAQTMRTNLDRLVSAFARAQRSDAP